MKWLKSFFAKQPDVMDMTVDELTARINEMSSEKISMAQTHLKTIRDTLLHLEDSLPPLEAAEINTKDPKMKQLVSGNRDSFIKHTRSFVHMLRVPDNITADNYDESVRELKEDYNHHKKKTGKSFHIASQLIGKPLEEPLKHLQSINTAIDGLYSIKTALDPIIRLRAEITAMKDAKVQQKINEEKQDQRKSRISRIQDEINQLRAKKDELVTSDLYRDLTSKDKRLRDAEREMTDIRNHINDHFSPLRKPFTKLYATTSRSLLKQYANEPFETLLEDTALSLNGFLLELERSLNEIVHTQSKREKVMSAVSQLRGMDIAATVTTYHDLANEIRQLDGAIDRHLAKVQEDTLISQIENLQETARDIEEAIRKQDKSQIVDSQSALSSIQSKACTVVNADVSLKQ